MNKRNLQDLNIDNYVNWYKGLTTNIFVLDLKKNRRKRYYVASYYLFSRSLFNTQNKRSKEIELLFTEIANNLDNEIYKLEKCVIKVKDEPFYYIPTFEDWQTFDLLNRFDVLIENLNEKIKQSALPEIEVLKSELERKNSEDLELINYYENGTPFLNTLKENVFYIFSNEVSNINYCKYLVKRIDEIETKNTPESVIKFGLNWELEIWQLSELIKALCLKKAFGNVADTKVINEFEKFFNIALKSHYPNIDRLQDKKQTEYFTHELKTEIYNYLLTKKPTK